jgi:hypothetical protein
LLLPPSWAFLPFLHAYYITLLSLCQYLFLNFSKIFYLLNR